MPNDPILDAIQGGGVAVADPDPILDAITRGGARKAKAAAEAVSSEDPILSAITGDAAAPSAPIVPFAPSIPRTPPTEAAARVNLPGVPRPVPSFDATQVPRNVFTGGPQEPGMATEEEEQRSGTLRAPGKIRVSGPHGLPIEIPEDTGTGVARAIGAGAPEGSVVANLTGQRGTKDNMRLFAPEQLMTESEQQQHPILAGAGEFAGGMTSPDNLLLLGLTAGAGELVGPGAQAVKRMLAAGFSLPMLYGAAQQVPEISEAFRRGDYSTAKRLLTRAGLTAATAGLAAHGMFEEGPATQPGFENVGESAKLASRAGSEEAPTHPAGHIGPAQEPLAPEPQSALKAQVDALAAGRNRTVYFPRGSESIPPPPEGARVTIVPGDQPGAGTWYHDEAIKPITILRSVQDGTFGQLLGNHQSKAEAISGNAPAAVVARDADGTEIKASLVDSSRPEIVAAQASTLARQFPNAKIGLEPAEGVVSERLGQATEEPSKASPATASRETPQVERRSEASVGTPPAGTAERRLAPGPPPEQIRLLTEYRRRLAAATTEHEKQTLQAQIDDISGTEGALKIGGGGEEMAAQIRAAREKSSGQPISQEAALANEQKRKTGVPRTAPKSKVKSAAPAEVKPTAKPAAVPRQPALAQRFSPEVLDEARQELIAAHHLASSFERPGRYFSAIGQTDAPFINENPKAGQRKGGTWYGVGSSRHIVADQFPWYAEISQGAGRLGELIAKGKGAEYSRLLSRVAESIAREKETAAPVIAEYAPRLREIAKQLKESDPELAQTYLDIANSSGTGFKNLRTFLEEKVAHGERTADFFRAIDAAADEAREAGAEEPPGAHGSVRQPESREPAEGTEAHAAEGAAAGSEFLTPKAVRTKTRAEKQTALPGFESAIDEQQAGAERVRGEQLSREARRPLGDVNEAAGEMERKSPLFRGTEASPQRELLGETDRPEVGDSITVSSGPLKGRTPKVTKTAESGVYVREGNGPIKFVKYGDFEVSAPKESNAAPEIKELIGKPGAYDPNVLAAGLDPRLLKFLIPEAVRERIGEEATSVRRSRALQSGLYDLDSQNAADILRARKVLQNSPGTPSDLEAIYHHLEDPNVELTPEQTKILESHVQPLLDASRKAYAKLTEGGAEVENYVHRIPVGKGNVLDRIVTGEGKLGAGAGLSKSAGATKARTMMALEDADGNREVVSIKGGTVTAWESGHAEEMGKIRGLETQGLKSKADIIDRQNAPLQKELDKLEAERRVLTSSKGREAISQRRIENIDNREAEIRDALQDSYRKDNGQLYSENDLRGRKFVDRNGKEWKITQATTREIEANTDLKYYKNALTSSVLNFLQLRRAERAYDFLENYKNSPDFEQVAAKVGTGAAPAGWRSTSLPQFRGYVFEPHTAEVLDWYAKRMQAGGPGWYDKVGNFLRTAIFFNPLIHTPNIGVHWIVEKGVTGFGPQNWGRILRSGSRAIDAVIHQNHDFLDALDRGAPLQSAMLERSATTKLLLERMGRELEANPNAAQRVAKALGYASPVKLIRSVYNFSKNVTWLTNDIAMLQATYEHMERTGDGFKASITDVAKHIPDYRLPTRIFDSPAVAKLMSNPKLTMFGAYHYGALRSYAEMGKSLFSEDVPHAERLKSLDRLAMLGLFTFVVYPQLDKLAKLLTGDESAEFRRAGASTFIWNLVQLAKGTRTPTDVVQSVATPAVLTKALLQLGLNRDFYTGKHIVDWSAPTATIAKQLARYGGQNIAPIGQGLQVTSGRRTFGQQAAGVVGIRTKVKTTAETLASTLARDRAPSGTATEEQRQASELMRTYEQKIRDGSMRTQELGAAVRRGDLSEKQAVRILQDSRTLPLVRDVKGLPLDQALRVLEKATPEEVKALRPILIRKTLNALKDRTPVERAQILNQVRDGFRRSSASGVPSPSAPRTGVPMTAPRAANPAYLQ